MKMTVIIPVYNAEKTIKKSIQSVITSIGNRNIDYEIICIDDGSTDNSLECLREMSEKNSSIIIIEQKNAGSAAARNVGLEKAKGDYIAFNDSDDEWTEDHCDFLFNILNKYPDIMCLAGNHDVEEQKLPKLRKIEENLFDIKLSNEILKNYFSPQATIINRIIVEDGIRFKGGMRYAEEGYFFYTIVSKYKSVFCNKEISRSILGKHKFGDSGLSGNLKEMEKGELQNIKYAYKNLGISKFEYVYASIFSILKYIRRKIIVFFRKRG